jgi:ribonuclease P/MRP protein subunit POP1
MQNKVPCFPHDFPDTEAYKSLADWSTLYDLSAQLQPHRRQPQKAPMPPPWDCVAASFHHICTNSMQCTLPILNIYIPRTIVALKDYVERMDSGDLISAGSVKLMDDGREKGSVCLVRVLVRAFKEGLFEDGAIVCAPCTDDLSGWTTR